MRKIALFMLLPFLGLACQQQQNSTPQTSELDQLIEKSWNDWLEQEPMFATSSGVHKWDDQLGSFTEAAIEEKAKAAAQMLEKLMAVDTQSFSREDFVNRDLMAYYLRDRVANFETKAYLIPILADEGFHSSLVYMISDMPFQTVKEYENYLSRLSKIPRYVDEHLELMRKGIAMGMTQARVVLEGMESGIEVHMVEEVEKSLFFNPFTQIPEHFSEADKSRISKEAKDLIMNGVVEAFGKFGEFMETEYKPAARKEIGASALPEGKAYYQQRVHHFTTLDISVEEVHQTGLKEVERIKKEMELVMEETGYKGSFKDFLTFLRTDPRFYPKSPQHLLEYAAFLAKKADSKLPAFFKRLPRQPYGVAPVPDHIAPKYTTGRYIGAPLEGKSSAYYWVNTYDLKSRPLYVLPSLTLHEAVPGHHLQISLAKEMEGLPDFRKHTYISAFGEGWGLYSEWLGQEMGMYEDPYDRFGKLTYEMWRACRLVVDTGIHAFGWSRDEVLTYMAENTALSIHEITTETDRYISWPGQALSYKMGELAIRDLRQKAENALGDQFDLREFHDCLLENGTVTLPILEEVIEAYISEKKASA